MTPMHHKLTGLLWICTLLRWWWLILVLGSRSPTRRLKRGTTFAIMCSRGELIISQNCILGIILRKALIFRRSEYISKKAVLWGWSCFLFLSPLFRTKRRRCFFLTYSQALNPRRRRSEKTVWSMRRRKKRRIRWRHGTKMKRSSLLKNRTIYTSTSYKLRCFWGTW